MCPVHEPKEYRHPAKRSIITHIKVKGITRKLIWLDEWSLVGSIVVNSNNLSDERKNAIDCSSLLLSTDFVILKCVSTVVIAVPIAVTMNSTIFLDVTSCSVEFTEVSVGFTAVASCVCLAFQRQNGCSTTVNLCQTLGDSTAQSNSSRPLEIIFLSCLFCKILPTSLYRHLSMNALCASGNMRRRLYCCEVCNDASGSRSLCSSRL